MFRKYLHILLIFLSIASKAHAEINFTIGNEEIPKSKVLISLVPTQILSPAASADIDKIIAKIKKNLESTNLINLITDEDITSDELKAASSQLTIAKIPNFSIYKDARLDMVLIIEVNFNDLEELELKLRLWDVLDERQMSGKFYVANEENYKKLANLISDEIFKAITGEKMGHFDSKVTYIAESGSPLKRTKRIALMDYDGGHLRYLTDGKELVLTPVFSKYNNEILFVRYFDNKTQIYSLNIDNAMVRRVGNFRGTTFAPAINPVNPQMVAFSVIRNCASNIYQMNLSNNQVERLTANTAINTTPSYSPDGNYIVFTSDKSGSEQIYMMSSNGRGIRQISSGSGSYSKPIFSPDGRFLTFTKIHRNQFSIGIIDTYSKNEKILTSGYLVEGAKWSPSGRYIIYSRKDAPYGSKSIPKLYVIDVLTGFERQLPTPKSEGATDPDWIMAL